MTKRIAIAELEGVALAYAVGKADGRKLWIASSNRPEHTLRDKVSRECFYPVENWSQAGPLIERYEIGLMSPSSIDKCWTAWAGKGRSKMIDGPTPLIAACRAIVAAHNPSGYVEVPDELVEGE